MTRFFTPFSHFRRIQLAEIVSTSRRMALDRLIGRRARYFPLDKKNTEPFNHVNNQYPSYKEQIALVSGEQTAKYIKKIEFVKSIYPPKGFDYFFCN